MASSMLTTEVESSPETLLVTAGYDKTVNLWNVKTGENRYSVEHLNRHVTSLAVGPKTSILAVAGSESISIYDCCSTSRNPVIKYPAFDKPFNCVGVAKDSRWIYAGSESKYAGIWDLNSGNLVCQDSFPTPTAVNYVSLHPNQKYIYVAGKNGDIFQWDLRGGNKEEALRLPSYKPLVRYVYMECMDVDPTGNYLAAVDNQGKCFFFLLHGAFPQLVARFEAHDLYATSCKFSPNSEFLATSSSDRTTKFWRTNDIFGPPRQIREDLNLREWKKVEPVIILKNPSPACVSDMAFNHDGQYIFTACGDKLARLWSVSNKEVIREYKGQETPLSAIALWKGEDTNLL